MAVFDYKEIIGIDPGTNQMGYAVIRVQRNEIKLLRMGTLSIANEKDPLMKLKKIYQAVYELCNVQVPAELAIESPFFGKNVQSMHKLGRAQGVAIAGALMQKIRVFEYSPRRIKQSITGNGNASKQQVAAVLAGMLHFQISKKSFDATDALATAVCHFHQRNKPAIIKKRVRDWKDFLAENRDRIIE
jgi:crossover junction endodeoxyribonuclease RuvC